MAQSTAGARERHGIAIRMVDGLPYSADRIRAIEGYVDGEAWRCSGPGCSAQMVPCAWEPEGKEDGSPYKRPPYFRSVDAQEHVPGCRPLEHLEVGGRGGEPHHHQGPAHEPPNRVRFRDEAPAPAPASDTVPDVGPGTGSSGRWGSSEAPQRQIRETSVPTIGPVCDAFVETALHHARPLRVDGCGGRSYGEVIRPLPPRGLNDAERRIFYGQIHVVRLADALRALGDDNRLEIPLWNVGGRWRVLDVRMAGWGADREIFLDRLRELVRRERGGSGLRFAAGRVAVAFFIGEARQWRSPPYRVDRFRSVHVVWADTWLPGFSGEPPRPSADPGGRGGPVPPRPPARETLKALAEETLSASRDWQRRANALLEAQRRPAAISPALPAHRVFPARPALLTPPAPPAAAVAPERLEPPVGPQAAFPPLPPLPAASPMAPPQLFSGAAASSASEVERGVTAMVRSVARSLRRTIFGR